jgi:type I restriction enzyme M protein
MGKVIDPKVGETVYDPGCGTGGFLAQAYEHMAGPNHANITAPDHLETRKRRTFYGREKDNAIYPIALANLVLHNIDEPHICHSNTLTGAEIYGGLFADAPALHDVVLMNPPFGGKEGKDAQTRFAYKTGATQVLFLQHVIDSLKPGGRCGIVLDEGVLFRTNATAFVQTKRKLVDDCDLWCIVGLPPGTLVNAGAGVKINLLFFTKGKPTDTKVGKKSPLTLAHFEEFFRRLPERVDSERSWTVTRPEIEAKNYDLKAVNRHARNDEDTRTLEELLNLIESNGREVAQALAALRVGLRSL